MAKSIDKELVTLNVGLNGKCITAVDPSQIGLGNFRELVNLRPGPTNPEPILGMTKINTAALANPNITTGIQFIKDNPTAESHILVHARDANNANGKVYRNSAVVPAQDAFTATALFSDSAGAGTPRFSLAPLGMAVYCNGTDSVVWPGLEGVCVGFIDYDPANSYRYNYLRQVTNDLTDSDNIATLHRKADTIDAATMLLLHCDGINDSITFTDNSPVTAHTVTAVGNAKLSTAEKAFGTASGIFDGTGDYLTVPGNADFDFSATGSDGKATIEFLIGRSGATCWGTGTYFSIATAGAGTDYMRLYRNGYNIQFDLVVASSVVATMSINGYGPSSATFAFRHMALVINKVASTYYYYFFAGGSLRATTTHTTPPANYNRPICIGAFDNGATITDPIGAGTTTYLDEFRISNTARWTASFEPPTQAYGQDSVSSFYVGASLPLQGINWYVQTANATAGTAIVYYWDGATWATVGTLTGVGATPFSATGKNTWTFASTASTAKQKVIDEGMAYWYKVEITNVDTTTQVYQVTLNCAMQQIRDLWDGYYRKIYSFLKYASATFNDLTTNVFDNSWDSSNTATYAVLNSLLTATDYLVFGFTERQTGLRINMIGGKGNATAGTVAAVYYCNGGMPASNSSAWASVGTIDDGTMEGGISLAKSGIISWNAPELANEFQINITSPPGIMSNSIRNTGILSKQFSLIAQDPGIPSRIPPPISTAVGGVSNTKVLYYYKVVFSQNLSADVQMYNAGGIPVQTDLKGYDFSFMHLNRLWLSRGNKVIASSQGTAQVFNGDDSLEFFVGDAADLAGATSLTTRVGNSIYAVLLFFKKGELWILIGSDPETMIGPLKIANIGLTAVETLAVIPSYEVGPGISRPIAVWQASDGIYMSDGFSVNLLSQDIADRFDDRKSTCINRPFVSSSFGAYDEKYNGYHWCYAEGSATAPDQEWVFRFGASKWFEIDRTAAKRLKGLVPVRDTSGNSYMYGFIASGYLERLENGTTFDGVGMTFSFWIGDLAPYEGDLSVETKLRGIKHVCVVDNATANTISITHYVDGDTTGDSVTAMAPQKTGRRITQVYRSVDYDGILHSSRFQKTGSYEPLFLSYYIKPIRLDKGFSAGTPVS